MIFNSDKKNKSIPVIVSVFLHVLLAVIFVFIKFKYEKAVPRLTELLFVEMAEKTPPLEKLVEETPVTSESVSTAEAHEKLQIPAAPETEEQKSPVQVDIPEPTGSKNPPETILKQAQNPKTFTPLASGKPPLRQRVPSPFERGETLFPGTPYELKKSGTDEKKSPAVPPEEVKDERRKFRDDILGVKMDGPLVLLPGTIHVAKSLKWKLRDYLSKRNLNRMREGRFTVLTEKDIRFLILLWRDGLLDPQRLSRSDRIFLSQNRGEKIQTNRSYLEEMYTRGLVTMLQVKESDVFRANVSRDELLTVLSTDADAVEDPSEKELCLRYIDLIARCFDTEKKTVIIPE